MAICRESYQMGYEAACSEMFGSANDNCHHEGDDSCRACGVVAEVAESLVEQLAAHMTEAELEVFTDIVIRVGERRRRVMKGSRSGGWVFLW